MIESPGARSLKSVALSYAKMKLAKVVAVVADDDTTNTENNLQILDETISAELTTSESKRILGERIHRLGNVISAIYIRSKEGEGEYDSPVGIAPPEVAGTDNKYQKHNAKIAQMHEAEIKKLGKEVDKFEKAIGRCVTNLRKSNAIQMKG